MKINRFLIILLFTLICNTIACRAGVFRFIKDNPKTQDTTSFVSPYSADNERCLKCHGQGKYEYTNETLGKQIRALMCSERIVKREEFYKSNHKSFSCTDCHSDQYTTFPHPGELRMEQKYNCIDCHGGDEKFAQYHLRQSTQNMYKALIINLNLTVFHAGNAITLIVTGLMSGTAKILRRLSFMIIVFVLHVIQTLIIFSF
jgi:hypothetical protein